MWSEMGDRGGNLESGGPGFTQRSMGAPGRLGTVGPPTPELCLLITQPSHPTHSGLTEDLEVSLGSQRTWRCSLKAQRTRLEGVYLAAKANEETLTVQSEVPGKPLPFQYFPCESALVADTLPLALNLGVKHCLRHASSCSSIAVFLFILLYPLKFFLFVPPNKPSLSRPPAPAPSPLVYGDRSLLLTDWASV